ncbi:indole-3-glycerol phosphate synthase TrpC [Ruminiclostridium herbifermentans]|uniref:Indole-3-glycerol phosphate synthase n=1 Tax=Ruminiclostridium herbifermentans TaxID=2488810 RepID=A0A4U7JHP7_9FIRM|nr:indole-3-glycerol phosphate synthase TrpC [Ruminiclostridium herbifermentans]QNU66231.1 indole-3-glycerol phosphate synthase TrpC [Ruminiclostridium herbifermentans]
MDILNEIAQSVYARIEYAKEKMSLKEIREQALMLSKGDFEFERALSEPGISFICEVKKASPSKGVISHRFPYITIAQEYECAGAAAISVITEPHFFLGSDTYLQEISKAVNIPILRKDITLDVYQIYEAKLIGASAVLLICSLLDEKELIHFINVTHTLGLSALIEVHTEDEVLKAVKAGARIIGVNNRNLKDFSVDISTSIRLRKLVPPDILFVAESGIRTKNDVCCLKAVGVDAVLVGEKLMLAKDKTKCLSELRG